MTEFGRCLKLAYFIYDFYGPHQTFTALLVFKVAIFASEERSTCTYELCGWSTNADYAASNLIATFAFYFWMEKSQTSLLTFKTRRCKAQHRLEQQRSFITCV
jgi:hypothetical protein